MTALLFLFLALDAACLVAVPVLLTLSRRRAVRARTAARLVSAVGAHRASESVAWRRLARETRKLGPRERLAGLIHYDPAKSSDYPVSLVVVLVVAAALLLLPVRLLARMVGPAALMLWPLGVALLARLYYTRHERLLSGRLYAQFPEALGMIVRAVRVGVPVAESMRVVAREAPAPTSDEFGHLADQIAIGVTLEESLREAARRSGLAEYRFFATALSLQAQTGGGLAETLDRLADTIRKRIAARERGKALASEARTTALILSALPFLIGTLLWVIDPKYMGMLLYDRGGNMLLGAAAASLGIGVFAMRTIIRRSLS